MSRREPIPMPVSTLPVAMPTLPQNYLHPGLSLNQLLVIIWAYRVQSALIAAGVLLLTLLLLAIWPRSYTTTATVMVNYDVNDPLNGKEFPAGLLGSYMATQIDLIQNQEVLLAVVDRLHLTENKRYTSGYSGDAGGLREWAAHKVGKNLTIKQGQLSSQLIYIEYEAPNAEEGAQVANTIADVYIEQAFARSTRPASERAQRYTKQLEELKAKVARAQEQVTNFHQRNGLIDTGKNDVEVELLANLQQQLVQAQNSRRNAESRSSGDQAVGEQVMASNLVQQLKSQLATQQAKLAELGATHGPRHPLVIELQSQISATQRSIANEVRNYSGHAASELTVARQLAQKLEKAIEDQRTRLLAVSQLRDQENKYRLELESSQAVYKRALDGYDQIMFTSSGQYNNVSFVSRATPQVKATEPRVPRFLAVGFLASLTLGLFGPLSLELLNRRVRCRDDLERDHGVPVLGEFGPLPLNRSLA